MSKLPVVQYPTYQCVLPSTGKAIKYRTYNVREEKLLVMAMEAGDVDTIVNNTKQVINNCTFGELAMDALPTFDIEYLFLQLRSKSVGETVELLLYNTECPMKDRKGRCDDPVKTLVDISQIKLHVTIDGKSTPFDQKTYKATKQIKLTDSIGVEVRHPTFEDLKAIRASVDTAGNIIEENLGQSGIDLIARCIVAIFDQDQVFRPGADFTHQEVAEWVGDLQKVSLDQLDDFYKQVPEIRHMCLFECTKCNEKSFYEIKGLRDFFV